MTEKQKLLNVVAKKIRELMMEKVSKSANLAIRAMPREQFPDKKDKPLVREWWHSILSNYGRYSCYAFVLALPSDNQLIKYLIDFGRELDLISSENCLVIAFTQTDFRRSGIDTTIQKGNRKMFGFVQQVWRYVVKDQTVTGYSVQIARFFNIGFEKFPCFVIFQDMRSPNHIVVDLKDMTTEEIAEKMRITFSIIQEAITENKNPLDALQARHTYDALQRKGKSIVNQLGSFANKTFEAAMEAWVSASIK